MVDLATSFNYAVFIQPKHISNIISACLPHGQRVPFPKNCFACMIQTGAKGSEGVLWGGRVLTISTISGKLIQEL